MTDVAALRQAIIDRSARIAVVGLGYVGIPVAASFAAAGFDVVGLDRDRDRTETLSRGELPLATSEPGLQSLLQAVIARGRFHATTEESAIDGRPIAILAVDTPIDEQHRPDARQLERACRSVAERVARPGLVIVESTVAPRTMRDVVAPLFGEGVFVMHCPERVRPGRLLRNLRGMSRLVGVADAQVGVLGTELYRSIVQAELVVTDWETAEVIKTAENAMRDVQIAMGNQLAVICDHAGVDVRNVREQVNRLWSDQPLILEPGPGVGGHCLPKDPWLLVSAVPQGATTALIEGARRLNEEMPEHVADIVARACADAGVALADATVVVLGLTYDADSDDERNAPGPRVASTLEKRGARVSRHDPFVAARPLEETCRDADVAVLVVPHSSYRDANWAALGRVMRHRVLVDCRRSLDADALRTLGFSYYGLGVAALR